MPVLAAQGYAAVPSWRHDGRWELWTRGGNITSGSSETFASLRARKRSRRGVYGVTIIGSDLTFHVPDCGLLLSVACLHRSKHHNDLQNGKPEEKNSFGLIVFSIDHHNNCGQSSCHEQNQEFVKKNAFEYFLHHKSLLIFIQFFFSKSSPNFTYSRDL